MILVDVYVPVMDETYDFYLDENVETGILIEQMADMICQKEQCPLRGDVEKLSLWRPGIPYRLSRSDTLQKAGVEAGDSLLLV